MLRLRILGGCLAEAPGAHFGPEAHVLFALALYLGLERGRWVPRRVLVELLWPDAPEAKARHNVRQLVYRLRRLGVDVEVNGDHCRVPAGSAEVDCERIASLAPTEQTERVLATVPLEVLPGYAPALSDAFAEWLDARRAEAQAQLRRALVAALGRSRAHGAWERVELLAQKCLRIDPLNEEATLALAESTAMRGNKRAALHIVDSYVQELGDERGRLEVAPQLLRRRISERLGDGDPDQGAPMVARTAAMALLSGILANARAHQGGACLLHGEAGVGKTRLVREIASKAVLDGLQVVVEGCRSGDSKRPLSVFVDLVPKLLELPGALGCAPESLKCLRRLTRLELPSDESVAEASDGASAYARIRRALLDLFDAVTLERSTLLAIEDLEWLDPVSADVLGDILHTNARRSLALVLTSRTAQLPVRMPPSVVRVPVTPLSDDDAHQLLRQIAGRRVEPGYAEFERWSVAAAHGNPLHLVALAQHWLATGESGAVPTSLQALFREQLSALSAHAARTLQAAIVLGKFATPARVAAVLGYEQTPVVDAVEELASQGLIRLVNGALTCTHVLTAGAALDLVTAPTRALLHARAAELLEHDEEMTRSPVLLWECAQHWREAGDEEKARRMALRYAEHLVTLGLFRDAIPILRDAQAKSRPDDERTVLALLARAYLLAGDWLALARATEETNQLHRRVTTGLSQHDRHELTVLEGAWWLGKGSLDDLLAAVEECVTAPDASTDHRVAAAAWVLVLASNIARFDSVRRAYGTVRSLRGFAESLSGDATRCALIYHTYYGSPTKALAATRQLLAIERRTGDAHRYARALRNASVPLRYFGAVEDAVSALSESLELGQRLHSPSMMIWASDALAATAITRGDLGAAVTHATSLRNYAHETGSTFWEAAACHAALKIALLTGDRGAIEKSLEDCTLHPLNELRTNVFTRTEITATRAWASRLLGNPEDAVHTAESALPHFYQISSIGQLDFLAHALSSALQADGDAARGERFRQLYLMRLRRETTPPPHFLISAG